MKPGGKAWLLLFGLILIGSPLIEGGTTYLPVTGLRLAILILAAGWLWQGLREPVWTLASSRFDLLIVVFWALTAVSLARSPYPYMTAYWYVNVFFLVLLYYLALQVGTLAEPARDRILHGTGTLLILMGIGQSLWAVLEFGLGFSTRASAGFFNPNGLAGYLLAISPLVAARFLLVPAPARRRALLLAVLALMLVAILCTRSRALVVAFLSFGVLLFARFRGKAVIGLAAALLLLLAVPNPLRERMLTLRQGDPYAWERLRIYEASLEMIRDHPAGVGLGLYKYYYPRYGRAVESVKVGRYEKTANTAHSELLHLAAELSPLAPLLLLGIALPLIVFVLLRFRSFGARVTPPASPDALGAACGLLAILAHALIDANLHETAIAVLAVVLAAMLSVGLGDSAAGIRLHRLSFRQPAVLKVLHLILTPLLGAALVFISAAYGLTEASSQIPELDRRIQKLSKLAPYNPGYAPLPDALSKALFQMAEQTAKLEFLEGAIKEESAALGLNPNNYQYAEGLGVLYLSLSTGLNEKPPLITVAEKYFQQALTLYPNNPFILERLAQIARLRGDWSGEERWLREALLREPYFFQARAELIRGLHRRHQAPAAEKELEILLGQIKEIHAMLKQQPEGLGSPYQRQLLSLPAGQVEALLALFNRKAEPTP